MRLRRAALIVLTGGAAASGALALRRRYATLKATGSLNPDTDLSGAPFGPSMQQPDEPPTGDARVIGPLWEPDALTALASWIPDAPRGQAQQLLAYAWAAPITLVGALLGLLSGMRPQVRDGVLVYEHVRGPAGMFLQARGFRATTMGHAILATSELDPPLMAHEMVHVRHAERLGIFSALLYGLLYPVYGYARHPMERAARTAARRLQGVAD